MSEPTTNLSDDHSTVADLKRLVAEFVAERKWEPYHDAKNLSMAIAIEAAELMEHFQWARSEELNSLLNDPAKRQEVTDEIADIACFLVSLASTIGVDLSKAMADKMVHNRRKYPAEQFQGHWHKPTS